jgi:hypothetical protein
MHVTFPGIHAKVRLRPAVSVLAFAPLMHLRIAFCAGIPRRRRRSNDGRIHNCPRADAKALTLQVSQHYSKGLAVPDMTGDPPLHCVAANLCQSLIEMTRGSSSSVAR